MNYWWIKPIFLWTTWIKYILSSVFDILNHTQWIQSCVNFNLHVYVICKPERRENAERMLSAYWTHSERTVNALWNKRECKTVNDESKVSENKSGKVERFRNIQFFEFLSHPLDIQSKGWDRNSKNVLSLINTL